MSPTKTKVLQDGMTRIIDGLALRGPKESLYLDGQMTIRVERISEYDAGNCTVLLSVRVRDKETKEELVEFCSEQLRPGDTLTLEDFIVLGEVSVSCD